MAKAKSLADFFSEDERLNRQLVKNGILHYSKERNTWIIGGSRWGVKINPNSVRPHTPWEIAVHECGHAVALLATKLRFEYVELSLDQEVNAQVVCKDSNMKDPDDTEEVHRWAKKQVLVSASGPIAASIIQYGIYNAWEQCAPDVIQIGTIEAAFFSVGRITIFIGEARDNIEKNWQCVLAIAKELVVRQKLSYDDCLEILKNAA